MSIIEGAIERGGSSAVAKLRRCLTRASAMAPDDQPLATGVTVTCAASNTTAATVEISPIANPARFRFTGGKPMPDYSTNNRVYFPVSDANVAAGLNGAVAATSTLNAFAWAASVRTESAAVVFRVFGYTSRFFRVLVDGKYVSKTPTAFTVDSGINHIVVDFAGVYAMRTITLEADGSRSFYGVSHEPTANLGPPVPAEPMVMLWTGDSYGEGHSTPPVFNHVSVAPTLGRLIGASDVRQVAVGGTSYINTGAGGANIRQQIPDWFAVNSDLTGQQVDVLVIGAGFNDRTSTFTPDQIAAEAAMTVEAARAACPDALILVLGPWGGSTGPSAEIVNMENAILTAVDNLAMPMVRTAPVSTDPAPWLFGTGRVGATDGSGNADRNICSDDVHPTAAGYGVLARRALDAYRAALASL